MLADEYLDEPGTSSLAHASEMALHKPAGEVILSGCAYAPRPSDTEVMVTLRLLPLQKTVRVIGDRVWEEARGAPSRPRPLAKVPLVYERAFGGRDATGRVPEACPENPVGVGFRGKGSRLPVAGAALPNLEDPQSPMRGPNDRTAPITSVRPGGDGFHFAVPVVRPTVVVRIANERHTPPLKCDTLAIDCDAARISLVFRATLPVAGMVSELAWIKVEEIGDAA